MIEHLPRIADMFIGFGWGAIVFWIVPSMIRQHKEDRKVNRWWTKLDVKGESSQWR